jgi:hypothetical protein
MFELMTTKNDIAVVGIMQTIFLLSVNRCDSQLRSFVADKLDPRSVIKVRRVFRVLFAFSFRKSQFPPEVLIGLKITSSDT